MADRKTVFNINHILVATFAIINLVRTQLSSNDVELRDIDMGDAIDIPGRVEKPAVYTRQQRMTLTYEIGVFYDDSFQQKYGHACRDIIRTLFRQAQLRYDLPSLTPRVTLAVTHIEYVRSSDFNWDFQKPYDSQLWDFGNWTNIKYPFKVRKDMYDLAMFLTTKNLRKYRVKGSVNGTHYYTTVGGSTQTGGACEDAIYNCGVTTIQGLHSAYTLGHELTHGIGAPDDSLNKKNKVDCEQGVMGYGVTDNFRWSNCSNIFITKFLQTRDSDCLFRDSRHVIWNFKTKDVFTPSEKYDYNKQCQLAYGPNFRRDDDNVHGEGRGDLRKVCEVMVCHDGAIRFTPSYTPLLLEGTDCRHNKRDGKCRNGVCVIG